ncbi:MAG: glycosyltransferase family 1 protein [Parcubacteria group bacterium]|jgi:glycosyltransferase involved in cell wall biosynthesis
MKIGIDGSRAFLKQRTGIEEYSYQVIKNLRNKLDGHQVVLYVRKNQTVDFDLPSNWKIKIIDWSRLWTQAGLSLEMLWHPVGALFVPAHTVPWIHPKKTIVTVHGLEYEVLPQAYSFWERVYMRFSIRNSCRWATTIVSVSQNTKQDLMRLYDVPADKIQVVYEGYEDNFQVPISNFESNHNFEIKKLEIQSKFNPPAGGQNYKPYLLFIGRLEERKNIVGIIKAFEMLKEKYHIEHKLVLAGRGGHGFKNIEEMINDSKYAEDIIQLGFVLDENKFELIAQADIFLFPTFYEGFGIPILEAQSVGVPVVTSSVSSMPEVAGESAMLVDPKRPDQIASGVQGLLSNKSLRDAIIEKGHVNVRRFSWDDCAQNLANIII